MQDGGAITAKTENEHTPEFLKELQAMPLQAKVLLTQARIDEFYTGYNTIGYGNAYISFSGGKDSTVLLDIARKRYPDIPAVFSNTGLEYPEIRKFALSHENVEMVQPKIRFDEVISQYGYPLIGKEVAEAIYYARKIRSQADGTSRETAAKRTSRGKWANYHRSCLNPDPNNPNDRDNFWIKPKETSWADWRRGCL